MNGFLAKYCGLDLPVEVLKSANGYYLGTQLNGEPISRESVGYWADQSKAASALASGQWQQRPNP